MSLIKCNAILITLFFLTACGQSSNTSKSTTDLGGNNLSLTLNSRSQTKDKSSNYHSTNKTLNWNPKKTALIICDMWDDHWCKGAANRVVEMATPMNRVIAAARAKGMLIIHAPSSVTSFYKNTPQRKFAINAPFAKSPTPLTKNERWGTTWCWPDPQLEPNMPVDDREMGCDCKIKCEIREAWTRQIKTLDILPGDAITDHGQETYNLLAQHGIDNVIIMGVHLNMCVLGRPFGIRQMVGVGKNIVLVRDMTDSMYDHEKRPFVNHYAGTTLIVKHVEQYWCPTILSTDLVGGKPFKFNEDKRNTK